MTMYKLPTTEAVNETLYLAESIVSNKGQAKYVCLDPWINALLTLASLGTIITYMIMRCRKCTLCRGLEYASTCHIYVFVSKNERYSPIKLRSTTGLLYNFVTSQKIPMEALPLGQFENQLGRDYFDQWEYSNKTALQCAGAPERKTKIVQFNER